ncbi:hypothetical protein [Sphingopyxis flava]|uniref:Uncharacterized protein n=1 Tax=Sphingopyxis flava TaxID=1507287 RepID=A0A1T5EVT2_9SPHN|nr:hypothetical protein [Sphingopyxis flava]SKB87929.1 hypothetical protein SAMN06295937_102533 [Sphingopyxis flava]
MPEQERDIGAIAFQVALGAAVAALLCAAYVTLEPETLLAKGASRSPVSVALPPPTPFTGEEEAQLSREGDMQPSDASLALVSIDDQANVRTEASARPSDPLPSNLLGVKFDLSDPYAWTEEGGSAIEIRKSLRVNGVDVGSAAIQVGEDSTLSIARDKLKEALARHGRGDIAEELGKSRSGGFVSFDEIRRRGVEVRYDAPSDRVVLTI